ncbi:unnamed protein product, partial [Mesorhabditis belari]|uniref:C2H2-type domain-containing protein n=1 Tax=Mesorhabditis belari TaxID=2138241 RepID=A0AAF3F550_9BILA
MFTSRFHAKDDESRSPAKIPSVTSRECTSTEKKQSLMSPARIAPKDITAKISIGNILSTSRKSVAKARYGDHKVQKENKMLVGKRTKKEMGKVLDELTTSKRSRKQIVQLLGSHASNEESTEKVAGDPIVVSIDVQQVLDSLTPGVMKKYTQKMASKVKRKQFGARNMQDLQRRIVEDQEQSIPKREMIESKNKMGSSDKWSCKLPLPNFGPISNELDKPKKRQDRQKNFDARRKTLSSKREPVLDMDDVFTVDDQQETLDMGRAIEVENDAPKNDPKKDALEFRCHVLECNFVGTSRKQRENHMHKHHPSFVNPKDKQQKIACIECDTIVTTNQQMMEHMCKKHNITTRVQLDFKCPYDFQEWLNHVIDIYSINFAPSKPVFLNKKKIYYLYCKNGDESIKQLYGANTTIGTSTKLPRYACACYLKVIQQSNGPVKVTGCVEHTGHRLGTELLRPSILERKAMHIYMKNSSFSLLDGLRWLLWGEGVAETEYTMPKLPSLIPQNSEEDANASLDALLQSCQERGVLFNVVRPRDNKDAFTIGYMDEQMREFWCNYAHKVVYIEEFLTNEVWNFRVTVVSVFDDDEKPRIAALYMSTCSDELLPLFEQLTSVWVGRVTTFVICCIPKTIELIEAYFEPYQQGEFDFQFTEWSLISTWAAALDERMVNRVDKFALLCALRRLLRITNISVREQSITELAAALKEMSLNQVTTFLSNYFAADVECKWQSLKRNSITDYKNPFVEAAGRFFRESLFLFDECWRIDELISSTINRVTAYNKAYLQTYLLRQQHFEPARELPRRRAHKPLDDEGAPGVTEESIVDDLLSPHSNEGKRMNDEPIDVERYSERGTRQFDEFGQGMKLNDFVESEMAFDEVSTSLLCRQSINEQQQQMGDEVIHEASTCVFDANEVYYDFTSIGVERAIEIDAIVKKEQKFGHIVQSYHSNLNSQDLAFDRQATSSQGYQPTMGIDMISQSDQHRQQTTENAWQKVHRVSFDLPSTSHAHQQPLIDNHEDDDVDQLIYKQMWTDDEFDWDKMFKT